MSECPNWRTIFLREGRPFYKDEEESEKEVQDDGDFESEDEGEQVL